jgi:hypothetical protein
MTWKPLETAGHIGYSGCNEGRSHGRRADPIGAGEALVAYYANAGPRTRAILHRDRIDALGVLEARDRPMPIGRARSVGQDVLGRSVYRLTVRGVALPGRWAVVDREFRPTQ